LAASHQVVAVDAPGHGLSSSYQVDLWEGARLLGEVGGEADYIGYSMGGRLALHLALAAPYLVRRLVLVGATAGIEVDHERGARRAADAILADGLERDGVDTFLERWLDNPLFATLPRDAAGIVDRRENTVAGLASSLRLMGTGTQEPLWHRLPAARMPALFVVGALDAKFRELAERMSHAWGGESRVAVVEGAGHAVHLEQPEAFLDLVSAFLQRPDGGAHDTATPAANSNP
jgi:2-succinyl-6-hydroxy-2,4-cyclohexadiene-1-carboxylate synthase